MIYFLFITLFRLVAASFCKKVADLYEQTSWRVSSAVSAYWNPWDYVFVSPPAYMPTVMENNVAIISSQKQDYVLQILYHALFKIALKVNPCVILVMVTTGWDSRMVWVKLRYWNFEQLHLSYPAHLHALHVQLLFCFA